MIHPDRIPNDDPSIPTVHCLECGSIFQKVEGPERMENFRKQNVQALEEHGLCCRCLEDQKALMGDDESPVVCPLCEDTWVFDHPERLSERKYIEANGRCSACVRKAEADIRKAEESRR
jgi:hypothetical protein